MRRRIFSEGERVLCYEPDPSRLRVLYDAKILRVSRKNDLVEYYIHFLGWSSSWDRYINEELLLENNEENRQLQSKLNSEAKKLLPKKKRKHNGSSSTVSESSRDSSDDESEDEALCETFTLQLPDKLKERLIFDRNEVKSGRLHKLPCSQDIVSILENYVQHYAFQIQYVRSVNDGPKKPRRQESTAERKTDLELCKEAVDGLRILFNHLCRRILIYDEERQQFSSLNSLVIHNDAVEQKNSRRTRELDLLLAQLEDSFLANKIPQAWDNETHRGRSLRVSTQHASIASGTLKREADDSDSATITSWTSTASPATSMIEDAKKWRMADDAHSPAQICGAYHLVRLLQCVPQIVPHLKMSLTKCDALRKHLRLLVAYLSSNEHLFEAEFS